MSIHTSSLSPDATTSGPTLADVLAMIPEMPVPQQARHNMASAINSLCRVVDRTPRFVPLHAPSYRKLIGSAAPGAVGMSSSRWGNVRSDVNRAMRLSGLSVNVAPEQVPLTDDWKAVALMAQHPVKRSILRRFGRFCCSLQLTPEAVGDDVVARFYQHLDLNQLSKTPERTIKDVIRFWNRFVAVDQFGRFRPLSTLGTSRNYTLSWDQLPEALLEDARAFKDRTLNPCYLTDVESHQPVQPATADQRHRMLRRLASAEILSGVDPCHLQSLADVVEPDRLKLGLQFFIGRNDGESNKQVFDMALLALTVARHWSRLPEAQIATIVRWVNKVRVHQEGMTEKNRERLRQFGDNGVIRALLTLPEQLIAKAERCPVNSRSALMVLKAVALALLTVAPLRLGNLRILDRQRHFRRAFSVDDPRHQLVIPAAEVKNKVDLEFPVPSRVMAMIERYLAVYQPLLTNGHDSTLLFPGRSGKPKHDTALRRNITEVVYKELGLRVNPHLFRHLGALLFLKVHPGQYESVRQFLGHKNIQTTINFYAGFETDEAMHRFNQVIDGFREGTGSELLGRDGPAVKRK
jgi:integrase